MDPIATERTRLATPPREALHGAARNQPARSSSDTGLATESTGTLERPERVAHNVEDTPRNRERIESAIQALDLIQSQGESDTRYRFKMHNESGKLQVTLVNYRTGEVVEEIPSSKLLEFSSALEDLTGLVVEERA